MFLPPLIFFFNNSARKIEKKINFLYFFSRFLSSDLAYVILFPQLLAVIHWPSYIDTYGCLAGYAVSLFLRLSAGEKYFGIPAIIQYPNYDYKNNIQKFPFRTTAMLSSIIIQLIVSFITKSIFGGKTCCPRCCDFLGVYTPGKSKEQNGVAQSNSGAALLLIDSALNVSLIYFIFFLWHFLNLLF